MAFDIEHVSGHGAEIWALGETARVEFFHNEKDGSEPYLVNVVEWPRAGVENRTDRWLDAYADSCGDVNASVEYADKCDELAAARERIAALEAEREATHELLVAYRQRFFDTIDDYALYGKCSEMSALLNRVVFESADYLLAWPTVTSPDSHPHERQS